MSLLTLPKTFVGLLSGLSTLWSVEHSDARPVFQKMDALHARLEPTDSTSYTISGVLVERSPTRVTYEFVGEALNSITTIVRCPPKGSMRRVCIQEWTTILAQLRKQYDKPTRVVPNCVEEWRLPTIEIAAFNDGTLLIGRPNARNRDFVDSLIRAFSFCPSPKKE